MPQVGWTLAAAAALGVLGCASASAVRAALLPGDRRLPVLLVHGIDDTGQVFGTLRERLSREGWRDIEAIDLTPNDGTGGLPRLAAQVDAAAARLRERTRSPELDVVGFSMGALISRYWIKRLGGAARVRRFVSISGPHHGTLAAWLRGNEGTAQMRPGSHLLEELARDEADWGPVEVVSLWTPFDLMIFPASSSKLQGASNQSFQVLAHPLMLTDPRVLDAVVEALGSPRAPYCRL